MDLNEAEFFACHSVFGDGIETKNSRSTRDPTANIDSSHIDFIFWSMLLVV